MRLGRIGRGWALGALLLGVVSNAARAQDTVVLVTHIEPAIRSDCPTPVAVAARLDAYLAASERPLPVNATIDVVGEPGGRFAATVSLVRGELRGERRAEGATCGGVLEAATLVIAVAADPDVALRGAPDRAEPLGPSEPDAAADERSGDVSAAESRPEPPGEPGEPEPPGEPAESAEPEPPVEPAESGQPRAPVERAEPGDPEPRTASAAVLNSALAPEDGAEPGASERARPPGTLSLEPWVPWLSVRVGPSLSLGVLPDPSFGLAVEGGLRFGLFEASLGFQWHSETERAVVAARGGRFSAYEGTARVGIALRIDVFELAPSARIGVAAMTAQGFGVTTVFTQVIPWVGLGGGLEARLRFRLTPGDDLAVVFGGDVLGVLTRPEYVIEGAETVFVPSDVAASFTVGLRGFFGGPQIE